MGRAVDVLAGILDIDGDACKVFEEDFSEESGVATGTAGGDEKAFFRDEGAKCWLEDFLAETVAVAVGVQCVGDGGWLLEDFAEHGVRVGFGGWHCADHLWTSLLIDGGEKKEQQELGWKADFIPTHVAIRPRHGWGTRSVWTGRNKSNCKWWLNAC